MSGVFSIASHWVLQYFPEVTIQEQIGCAHFLPSFAILVSSRFRLVIQRSAECRHPSCRMPYLIPIT